MTCFCTMCHYEFHVHKQLQLKKNIFALNVSLETKYTQCATPNHLKRHRKPFGNYLFALSAPLQKNCCAITLFGRYFSYHRSDVFSLISALIVSRVNIVP